MKTNEIYDLPQGEAPNYDEWKAAEEDLGPDATQEQVEALARAYAQRRNGF